MSSLDSILVKHQVEPKKFHKEYADICDPLKDIRPAKTLNQGLIGNMG